MPKANIIGVDLGGTKISLGRYDADSLTLEAEERVSTKGEFQEVMDELFAMTEKLRTPETLGIGIGVPGLIRQPEGMLVKAPNIPNSDNFDLIGYAKKKTDLKVCFENDANCFALAEAMMGAGKGKRVVEGITMGTGVGGGIVVDGKLFRGGHGYAAEVGHMLLKPGEVMFDTDDKRGSVEQYISGTAMGKRCEAAKRPEDYLEGEVCAFLQPQVFREVAWFVVNLTYLLDPTIIVFGGSAGHALARQMEKVRAELPHWMLPNTSAPELIAASVKDAGRIGAALLCKE